MDNALERTIHGKHYTVKGVMTIPFEIDIKAIDEEDAEELTEKQLDFDDLDAEQQKIVIEEVMRNYRK